MPDHAVVVDNDQRASELVTVCRRANTEIPPIALEGGDLRRTLGGNGQVRPGFEATEVTVDLGAVLLDGELHWFVAHLAAHRSWLWGEILVVANAAFLGHWNIAPRAHPGDGVLDIMQANLSFRERLRARGRMPSGTHVPHPQISIRRRDFFQTTLDDVTPIRIDGVRVCSARNLSVRVASEALRVWI